MLRLIVKTMPVINSLRDRQETANTDPIFRVFEFDCPAMEEHLKSPVPGMHRRLILGYETFEAPKKAEVKEEKKVNPELLKRLEQSKGKGNGEQKSKFAKWEEKAKLAKAKEAKGYSNGATRSWWGGRKAATT